MILVHAKPEITVHINKDDSGYVSVEVHQNRDGVNLADVVAALKKHKKQFLIQEALKQGNVTIWVAVKQYMQMVGSVSPEDMEVSKQRPEFTAMDKFQLASVFRFYDETVGLDAKQKRVFNKLKLL